MNTQEHLLTIVAEECCEVGQRATKALRFGIDEVQPDENENPHRLTNRERLLNEFNDLCGTMEMVFGYLPIFCEKMTTKQKRISEYMEYSRKQGTVTLK